MSGSGIFEQLAQLVVGRRVVPPAPPQRVVSVPADDGSAAAAPGQPGIALALFITYRDSKQQISRRRIACKRFEPATETLLAFCFERKAHRRFKVSGIEEACCPETGEVYDLGELVSNLNAGVIPIRDERLLRMITVLVFMMKCDGLAHRLELDAIETAAAAFALRFDGDDSQVAEALRIARRLAPDDDDFLAALRWITRHRDARQLGALVARQVDALVLADGKIASEEAVFAGYVRDILGAAL